MSNSKYKYKRDIAKRIAQRKQKTRVKINDRRIDKRKHYGVGVNIEKYKKIFTEAFDFSEIEDWFDNHIGREGRITEGLIEDILSILQINKFFTIDVRVALGTELFDAFKKGSRRLFNREGERVEVDIKQTQAIEFIKNEQKEHFQSFLGNVGEEVQKELTTSIEEGEPIIKARDRIMKKVDNMKKVSAKRIARSEIIKSSAKGTEQSLIEAGIEEFVWLATIDDGTCEQCEDLNKKVFEVADRNHPMPVESTHPNCRCTIIANIT